MDRERDRGVADDLIEDARKQIGGDAVKEQPGQSTDRQGGEDAEKPKD
ncbi:hypothetical protein [Methylobacterium sp. J-068]|nr:hypothetical protein [Methylobacterium sp. J-068]MCJ2032627.1 hypothetical protein [Methylobacterium sp. J-068]